MALPTIPEGASDWMPLVEVWTSDTGETEGTSSPALCTTTRQIGPVRPDSPSEPELHIEDASSSEGLSDSLEAIVTSDDTPLTEGRPPKLDNIEGGSSEDQPTAFDPNQTLRLAIVAILSLAGLLLVLDQVGIL